MKKIQITVSDSVHEGLLSEQFKRKMAKNSRTALAEVASDILEDYFNKENAPKKS